MRDRLSGHNRFALLVLAVALIIVFHRLLLGEVFFWGLPALQFYPWREYAFDLVRNGQLPLWNPYNGAGAPLLANYQSALLYPLNWFGLALPLAWSMSVTAVLHLFIAGLGMWQFSGRLGLPDLGRGVSTLAFGMTSYLVARLGTYPTIFVAAWIPWALWASVGVLTHGRRRDMGYLAVIISMQLLAGHAQTTWYSMLLVGSYSAWWGITNRPIIWRRWSMLLVGFTLAGGIAAAQLLPTGELLSQSQRSGGVAYDTAMNFSYAPIRSFNLLMPNFFGTPADGSYITEGAFFEDAVYVGLIPLISALIAISTWVWGKLRRAQRPDYFSSVPFWLIVVVIAYILALGKNSPIFPLLYENIPTFGMFQAPVRWHIWTAFGLSMLAGIGVGMWTRGYWVLFATRLAVAASIGAAILAIVAPQFLPADVTKEQGVLVIIRAVVVLGIFGALAGALTLTQPEFRESRWYRIWSMAVLVVVGLDLGYASWGLNPTVKASFYDRQPTLTSERSYWDARVLQSQLFGNPGEKLTTAKSAPFLEFKDYRVLGENQEIFRSSNFPNINLLDRSPLLNNFDPLLIGDFKRYLDLLENNPDERIHLLKFAGVSMVYQSVKQSTPIADTWESAHISFGRSDNLEECQQQSIIRAIMGSAAAPGMYFDCPANFENQSAIGRVEKANDNYRVTVVDNAPSGAWVVFAETYYPGWVAFVDDQSVDMVQANLAFRAVNVPTGTHEVRFEYRPRWLLPGLLISVVSVFITVILFRTRNPDTHA